jgi:hypothetical protein
MILRRKSLPFLLHCCLVDPSCWREWWEYGSPMRLHVGRHHFSVFPSRFLWKRRWEEQEWILRNLPEGPPLLHEYDQEGQPSAHEVPVSEESPGRDQECDPQRP